MARERKTEESRDFVCILYKCRKGVYYYNRIIENWVGWYKSKVGGVGGLSQATKDRGYRKSWCGNRSVSILTSKLKAFVPAKVRRYVETSFVDFARYSR